MPKLSNLPKLSKISKISKLSKVPKVSKISKFAGNTENTKILDNTLIFATNQAPEHVAIGPMTPQILPLTPIGQWKLISQIQIPLFSVREAALYGPSILKSNPGLEYHFWQV